MKHCYGTAFENLDACKTCDDFSRCYKYSKAKKESEIFREIEKEREERRFLDFLQKKFGYGRY